MRHHNMTFSLPDDLRAILYAHVGKRGMSGFVSEAIRKALEEEKKGDRESSRCCL